MLHQPYYSLQAFGIPECIVIYDILWISPM